MKNKEYYILGSGALALSISYLLGKVGIESTLITNRLNRGHHKFIAHYRGKIACFYSKVLPEPKQASDSVLIVATKLHQIKEKSSIISGFKNGDTFFCQNGLILDGLEANHLVWHISSVFKSPDCVFINHFDCFYYNKNCVPHVASLFLNSIGGEGLDESDFVAEQLCKFAVACTSSRLALNGEPIGRALRDKIICKDCTNIIEEIISLYLKIIPCLSEQQLGDSKERVLQMYDISKNRVLSNRLSSSYTSLYLDLRNRRPTELPWLNDRVIYDASTIGTKSIYNNTASKHFVSLMCKKQRLEYHKTKEQIYGKS